jgi:uncharacterized protein (TIGR02611 family)
MTAQHSLNPCSPIARQNLQGGMHAMRRGLKVVGGFALLATGIVMLVTPGPGWLAIAGGIGLLATEYVWAKRIRDRVDRAAASWKMKKN